MRYIDDYLIAFNGSKKIAKMIKKKSENFLKLQLHFEIKQKKMAHSKNNKVTFLGFNIKASKLKK